MLCTIYIYVMNSIFIALLTVGRMNERNPLRKQAQANDQM